MFGGSGITRDAGLPDWRGLGTGLLAKLVATGRTSQPVEQACTQLLANVATVPAAIEVMLSQTERRFVAQAVRELLEPTGSSHVVTALASWRPKGLVTTNFDHVVDAAIRANGYRLSNSQTHLKTVTTAVGSKSSFLWKPHGDMDDVLDPTDPKVAQGGAFMVLSRADFAALIQADRGHQMIAAFLAILQNYPVVFLGYSMGDPDIRWILDWLSANCQFVHPSWFIHRQGDTPPGLPTNVVPIPAVSDWTELADWMTVIAEQAKKGSAPRAPAREPMVGAHRAYLAISRYLTDLESPDLSERVLASALFDEFVSAGSFELADATEKVAQLLGVGPRLAADLATAMLRYLADRRLIRRSADRYHVIKQGANALTSRVRSDWSNDRGAFFKSISNRLAAASLTWTTTTENKFEEVLIALCSELGESMAEWVSRGIGTDVGWPDFGDTVSAYFVDPEERRQARAVLKVVLTKPSDVEIPYLYRLLGATFLANTVRLNPVAAAFLRDSLTAYELYLDANVLLPLVVAEHPNHQATQTVIEESRRAGVQLFALHQIYWEVRSHRAVARRDFDELGGDVSYLRELADAMGMRTNVFVQGYLAQRSGSHIGMRADWREYLRGYSDREIQHRVEAAGIQIIDADPEATSGPRFASALNAIRQEWVAKLGHVRDDVLNANEAVQMLHIYARRDSGSDRRNHVWFLSNETVLHRVFDRQPSRWGLPATFPYSAWVAFLDARLPQVSRDPGAVVKAILKGQPEAFAFPSAINLVREKAFGDRITSREEEDALSFAASDHAMMSRVEAAQRAVSSRGRARTGAGELEKATEGVVGEISIALDQRIGRLREAIAARERELAAAQERILVLETRGGRSSPTKPSSKKRTTSTRSSR